MPTGVMFYGAHVYGLRLRANYPLPGVTPAPVPDHADLEFTLQDEADAPTTELAGIDWGRPVFELHAALRSAIWSGSSSGGTFWRVSFGRAGGRRVDFVIDSPGERVWASTHRGDSAAQVSIQDLTSLFLGSV